MTVVTPPAGTIAPSPSTRHDRSALVDAIRAIAATAIVWHHLARYWPAADSKSSALFEVIRWLDAYAPWAATVFFVLGGYVIASSTSHRVWDGRQLVRFAVHRYCRLGLPYLAAIAVTMAACAYGRGWLADDVVGAPPTVPQVLAHVVFLQDILGYESLSAGLWFVCIIFQLDMLYAAMLWVDIGLGRERRTRSMGINRRYGCHWSWAGCWRSGRYSISIATIDSSRGQSTTSGNSFWESWYLRRCASQSWGGNSGYIVL